MQVAMSVSSVVLTIPKTLLAFLLMQCICLEG